MTTKYIHNKDNDERIEYLIRNNYQCDLLCNCRCPFVNYNDNTTYFCTMNEQTVNEYIQEVLQ